eukprot:PRCOL_00001005-RA
MGGAAAMRAWASKAVPLKEMADNYLDGTSLVYLEEMHADWREGKPVDPGMEAVFRGLDSGKLGETMAAAVTAQRAAGGGGAAGASVSHQSIQESMRLLLLVRAYQVSGHFAAKLDPLGLWERPGHITLDPALYGFTEEDMDREFFLGTWRMSGFLSEERPVQTLRQIISRLEEAYCGTIGFEYMHIPDRERCNWLRERIESQKAKGYSKEKKKAILDRLMWSEHFETFCSNKFTAAKRFGLEGGESIIPGMKSLLDRSAENGVESVVIGMAHRGRLNVLGNVVRKPLRQIFNEFLGKNHSVDGDDSWGGSGDVKYHLGTSFDRPTVSGKRIHLSLLANPSHLEAVNPVVCGKTRAKQYYANDDRTFDKVMGVQVHGDGSFAGQGVCFETMHMSELPEYTTGGSIHVVVNNQVAFTTDPKFSRSSPYCTDLAKAVGAPVFHVNADDPEAVVAACELAADWRSKFKSDVVLDLVCYRRHGHNEIDEPSFTQPQMYAQIKNHPSTLQLYKNRLLEEGTLTQAEVDQMEAAVLKVLNEEFDISSDYEAEKKDWLSSNWDGLMAPTEQSKVLNTGVASDTLKTIASAMTKLPEGFSVHRGIKRVYDARRKAIETGEGIDWATAEALAFGTILAEGNHVRLSGQDVERGTFSHRHALLHDQKTGERYVPLDNLFPGQDDRQFTVSNSSLSEFGVLGFELGYSMESPNQLVLWEAQFGDFANTAQVIIDQFISSGESKWLRQTGLVMLLPHGYDGQGPEHSSARMERYLQMSDEHPDVIPDMDMDNRMQLQHANWQIVNCTTPANYFHVLRRQLHRQFRKPLIVFSPKALLRHPMAKSNINEFDDEVGDCELQGTRFKRLIYDRKYGAAEEPDVKRLILCSGKVYYDLAEMRENNGDDAPKSAIARVEQLSPFPFDLVMRELKRYPNAEVVWCQEEPMNMGPFAHMQPRLRTAMRAVGRPESELITYAGRSPAASPATGFLAKHVVEQEQLCTDALTGRTANGSI